MGIHYYPNRWWALAVPAWLVVLVVWIYVALASYNTRYLTLPLGSVENIVDLCGKVAVVEMMEGQRKGQETEEVDRKGKANTTTAHHQSQASDAEPRDWKSLWSIGTDAVLDVPIGGVCEILYGSGREDTDLDSDTST
jgi:phosphatidylinositol glycan class P protein